MALLQPIISSVEHHVTLERVGSQDVLSFLPFCWHRPLQH